MIPQLRYLMVWLALPASVMDPRPIPPPLLQFLRQVIALSRDQLNQVTGGAPVVKAVRSSDQRAVVLFSMVRIDVPRPFYIARAANFQSALRDSSRSRFALFSTPAAASDVRAFSLPPKDVQDLANCRPGACNVKLSAKGISDLKARAGGPARLADSVADAYFRERMAGYITAYRTRGNAAMIVYDDQKANEQGAMVLNLMLSRAPFLYQYPTSLEQYLREYPSSRPAGVQEVQFWAEDDLSGLKPIFLMKHEVIYSPPELPGSTLIVTKQLYADHYLDGGLDLTAVVDQSDGKGNAPGGVYLVRVDRFHFDSDLPSGWLLNVRSKVTAKLSDRLAASLRDDKARSERAYAASGATAH